MSGLRNKLLIGFGSLLTIFLAGSLLANRLLNNYSGVVQGILREDVESLAAAKQMQQSVDLLDRQALHASAAADSQVQQARAAFDQALELQCQRTTFPDEARATTNVGEVWKKYQAAFTQLADADSAAHRQQILDNELLPASTNLRDGIETIFNANFQNAQNSHAQGRQRANTARRGMHTLIFCGVALGIVLAFSFARMILRPVRLLTTSAVRIAEGDLDLALPITSHDELGGLAEAFNHMAAELRKFRQIDAEKLIRSQRTTQLAIDSLPDGVVLVNASGTIELTNRVATELFDLHPDQSVYKLPSHRLATLHDGATSTKRIKPSEVNGYRDAIHVEADETERFFLPKAVPITGEKGLAIGSTIVLADVTEFRRLDQLKDGLLSMVSHELRTPLTSLLLVLPLVLDQTLGPLTEDQRQLLTAARNDANRLHRIVETLLDQARIASGKAPMDLRTVPAAELVGDAIKSARDPLSQAGIVLEVQVPQEQLLVSADPQRLSHVFSNLLANAIRYTARGKRIQLSVRPEGDSVKFELQDEGTGIPKRYLGRVFERFFRVPGQPGDSGTGLGLPIVKSIIEAHGGRIGVESAEGQGTTVWFTLRRASRPTLQQEGLQS